MKLDRLSFWLGDSYLMQDIPIDLPKWAAPKSLLLGGALVFVWFALQILLNLLFAVQGNLHSEGAHWVELEKAYVSPAACAYAALAIGYRYFGNLRWRVVIVGFLFAILAADMWSLAETAEILLPTGRISEWRSTLWETVGGTLSALVAIIIFYFRHIERER